MNAEIIHNQHNHQHNPHTNADNSSVKDKIDELGSLIDKCKFTMMVTRDQNGLLFSRAMHVRKRVNGVDLYLLSDSESYKMDHLTADNHVNLAFYSDAEKSWASLSGTAKIITNRSMIEDLWTTDIKAWLGDKGDNIHDGSKSDPRLIAIYVEPMIIDYYLVTKNKLTQAYEMTKGALTGSTPDIGVLRHINHQDLQAYRKVATN